MGFWIFMLIMDLLLPFTMIGFGRNFMKKAPKEINSVFGYRTSMSMKNKDTWEFAHKYCGKVWYVCGMVLISLLPMLFNQYGGLKGVQEITGLINLLNPIGIVSVILFVLGVWFPFKKRVVSKSLGALGVIGIVVSEIYKFLTWHTLTVTGEVSLQNSIRLAFLEFYIGLTISLVMVIAYFVIDK